MKSHQAECQVVTTKVPDFVDITDHVEKSLQDSGLRGGQVTVFAPETTCSLVVNELEEGLFRDLEETIARLELHSARGRQVMLGSASVVVPAVDGRLKLGMWQRVLLVELGEPQIRTVVVQVLGE